MIAPIAAYTMLELMPCRPGTGRTLPARIAPNLTNLPAGAVLQESSSTAANAIWSIAGTPAGNWTLTFRGFTTAPLSNTITAANLRTALNLLPSINGAITASSGGAIGTAACLLTFGGGSFASSPVELPTANVAMTITNNTVGNAPGTLMPAALTSSTAKFLNKYALSTDGAGNISFADVPSGAEWQLVKNTVPVWHAGEFDIRDIPQAAISGITGGYLDSATTLGSLGKLISGSLTSGKGVLRLGV